MVKNYLNFTLKGSQLLLIWIATLLFFIIPCYYLIKEFYELTATEVPAGGPSRLFFFYLMVVLAACFTFVFFNSRLVVQSLEYRGIQFICDFHTSKYIGIIISGLLLSIITIGIYIPWFIRNLHRYFVHGILYNEHKFAFRGTGSKLFMIMSLAIFIPFIVVGFIVFTLLKSDIEIWIYQIMVISSLVAIVYLTFKWMVNIRYKDYLIQLDTGFFHAMWKIMIELVLAVILVFIFSWLTTVFTVFWLDTDFFPKTGKMVIELVLAVLTLGFYFPMAFIRLYRYFTEHTRSNVIEGKQINMGYDGDQVADFLFMWGQILLTLITCGIYYPWAFSRVAQRLLTQTFISVDLVPQGGK
jgi:uncharacterized membrane protein YjgN (DUF898 family)